VPWPACRGTVLCLTCIVNQLLMLASGNAQQYWLLLPRSENAVTGNHLAVEDIAVVS
jgi:hypothetical protein